MAQRVKNTAANGNNGQFPPEAFDYNDDVSTETVTEIRATRGVDVSNGKWKVIDALGQVVPA